MLNVNTIEFGGRKACINSYSDHPALVASMKRQLAQWKASYPNAKVQTERMSEDDTRALVALNPSHSTPYEIGQASLVAK